MTRMFPRAIHNTQEAAEELRDLAGDATYRQLLERHPGVTNSLGLTGSRDPPAIEFPRGRRGARRRGNHSA